MKTYIVDGQEINVYPLKFWWVGKSFRGITLNGKIYRRDWETASERGVRHEQIHALQQKELGNFLFYLKYIYYWIVRFGYYKIPFEKEAYANQMTPNYLNIRERNAWKQYK